MDKKIKLLIEKYSDNELLLNKLVVSAFANFNKIEFCEGFLLQYIEKMTRNYLQTLQFYQSNALLKMLSVYLN